MRKYIKTSRKIPRDVLVRTPGVLPMLYRASELAADMHVSVQTLVTWSQMGMPHQHDKRGHIWISGPEFAAWIESERTTRRGPALKPGEAYCVRCRQPVALLNPTRQISGKRVLLQGNCPQCGTQLNRGEHYGKPKKLLMD